MQKIDTLPGTVIPKTPNHLFKNRDNPDVFTTRRAQTNLHKIVEKIEYPDSGGILIHHRTFDHPEKGHRDDFLMQSTQMAKHEFLVWITWFLNPFMFPVYGLLLLSPWKIKVKFIESWIKKSLEFTDFIETNLHRFYLEEKLYMPRSRQLMKGIRIFLTALGVNAELADRFATMFVSFIEYDMAYFYRLGDIFSEADKTRMLKHPAKEIKFLVQTLAKRDNREHLVKKFDTFARLLTIILWLPKVRRAFKKAVSALNFEKLGLDKADHYHVRNMSGYNFFGMTVEERNKKYPPTEHLFAQYDVRGKQK